MLILQRHERVGVGGGFWSLPGALLEPGDAQTAGSEGMAHRACALRALRQQTQLLPPALAALAGAAAERAHVPSLQALASALGPHRWARALAALVPLGVWTTPAFGPSRPVAHHFALELVAGAPLRLQPHTWQAALWVRPAAALAAHAEGVLALDVPLLRTLEALAEAGQHGMPPEPQVRAAAASAAAQDPVAAWRGPMVPGIAALPIETATLPPFTHTNCWLVGERTIAVVDPGATQDAAQAELLGELHRRVAQGARIASVWLTHHHTDHVGAAARIARTFGARVRAHADAAHALRGRLHVDAPIADGERLVAGERALVALHTAGHARGHLCFYAERGGHLLAGDEVLGTGIAAIEPGSGGDMAAHQRALKRLLSLPRLGLLLPGHGPPVAASARRIGETWRLRQAREALLLRLLEAGPQSLGTLVARAYRGTHTDLRGPAAATCRAHLDALCADGRAVALGGASHGRPPDPSTHDAPLWRLRVAADAQDR